MHAGLCERCAHRRLVRSARGSTFSLCQQAARDPRLDRYPRLPVLACHAFAPRDAPGETEMRP